MHDLLRKVLEPMDEVQDIRGISMPIGLQYLQLVVTGPPGAGKSYYINQIRGWPNEGYIDLTRKGWWRDQTLTYRPREVHLGMPFEESAEPLTVFDKEWLEASPPFHLDFSRIRIPPAGEGLFRTNWLHRYIFEFLLPAPEVIFERRSKRNKDGYFPVDTDLTLDMVVRQVQAYQEVALYLHRAGMNVYIRKGLEGHPMRICEKGVPAIPRWSITTKPPRPSLKSIAGWKQLLGLQKANWFTLSGKLQYITEVSTIAHDGKMFEMHLGDHVLCFYPEIPIGVKRRAMSKNWIISNPGSCAENKPIAFARLKVGETVVIGKSNKDYDTILNFSENVAMRHVAVTNRRGDLTLTPISPEKGIGLMRSDDTDYRERIDINRQNIFLALKNLYGGPIQHKSTDEALDLLRRTNDILETEPRREVAKSGLAGGIVRLEGSTIPIIVGDLHGQVDNLLKILSENCLLFHLQNKTITLIILGDAFHSEIVDEMEDMDSSILMIDLLCTLKTTFPNNFFYLAGNHDSFSPDISKNGISQGTLMKEQLYELRGEEYISEMERFFKRLPYIIASDNYYGCHAAPPRSKVKYKDLVNIADNENLIREITTNRIQRPNYLGGYNKNDVKRFRKVLDMPKKSSFIVGHTPLDPFGSFWQNVGTIKNHHIVYSAHVEGPAVFQRVDSSLIPLSFPAEPLTKLINNL